MDHQRLSMPVGEAMFTQRSIRCFKPDPIRPMGYPETRFGGSVRLPTSETTFVDRWGGAVPWK